MMREKNVGQIGAKPTAIIVATALAAGALSYERYPDVETVQASAPPAANISRIAPLVAQTDEYTPQISYSHHSLQPAAITSLGRGAWSYFADPRAVADTWGNVYTGWITPKGKVEAIKYHPSTGKQENVTIGDTGVDDHNNPAFSLRPDGRIMAFFSPHSGRYLPKKGKSEMSYRVTKHPGDIRTWESTRRIPVNAAGKLGYTYPNPVDIGNGELFVAWRGGNWLPTYSINKNNRWSPAQEIVRGDKGRRPYAKYAPGLPGSGIVHMAYTDANPVSGQVGIHYLQYRKGKGFFGAAGDFKGNRGELPLPVTVGDTVHQYNELEGSNWVMDVADDDGNPVIVYSMGASRAMQHFRYARWNGQKWEDHEITPAYDVERTNFSGGHFQTGGVTLDHDNPSRIYFSKIINGQAVVGTLTTPDKGTTWQQIERLSPEGQSCFRPAAVRESKLGLVAFLCGRLNHWTDYNTQVIIAHVNNTSP